MDLSRRMLDAVGDLPVTEDESDDEFALGAFRILVAALAKLDAAGREHWLVDIEDQLRRGLGKFDALYAARRRMN